MFESIRTHRKWLMPVVSLVVFVPFVISGIYGFTNLFTEASNTVAKVGGKPITQQELEGAQRERVERLAQMLGGKVDAHLLDTPQSRAATLDGLISERALALQSERNHLVVTERRLQETILAVPAFQVDGHFDEATYKTLLAARGMTPAGFESQVRGDLLRQVLGEAIAASALLPASVAERLRTLQHEQRAVRLLKFGPDAFLAQASVGEDAIKADYDAHRDRYRTPESGRVEFVVLRPEDVAARIEVPEADVRAYYEQNRSRYSELEQRRASHILVTVGKDGSAPDKDAARKLAADIAQRARANPAGFAKLATQYSKDPGSADKGGDLGWFGKGMMDHRFEEAAFGLKDGEVSGVVESDFGLHIIHLTGVKPAQVKPLAEVRGQIEDELKREAARKSFAELAEQFSNFVYEQSEGLAAAADKFKVPLQTIDQLTREGAARLPAGLAAAMAPPVLDALFSPESVAKRRNTKAIEVAGNALVSARLVDYKPAAVQPLEQVRPAIKVALEREAAGELARKAGKARLAELQKDASDAGFEAEQEVGRGTAQGLPLGVLEPIMAASADKLPAYVGAEMPGGGYVVAHVLAVKPAVALTDDQRAAEEQKWRQQAASEDQQIYVQAVRERLDAKVVRSDLTPPARKGGDTPAP